MVESDEIWHKIGVFGTLKSGLPNHYRMQSKCNGLSKFVCNAISKDKYPLVVSSRAMVPFILNKKGAGHNIHFEIYEVDSQMKIFMDKFENVGVLYDVEEIPLITEKEDEVVTPVYILNNFHKHMLDLPFLQSYTEFHASSYVLPQDRKFTIHDVTDEVKSC